MKAISEINDPRLVKALAHPLRVSILGILEDREASPSELADELRAPLGNVSYHVRILSNLDLIKLTKKKPRRGAIEHYYRARGKVVVTDGAWKQVPKIVKEALVDSGLRQLSEYAATAAIAGGFDRSDAHMTRQAVTVDEQGFGELAEAFMRLLHEMQEIQGRSAERLKASAHAGEINAGTVLMLFEAPVEASYSADRSDANISVRRARPASRSRTR